VRTAGYVFARASALRDVRGKEEVKTASVTGPHLR
jgi:hypothetical protein